jgi:hypothetical protein
MPNSACSILVNGFEARRLGGDRFRRRFAAPLGMSDQGARHVLGGQHEIGHAGVEGGAGHAVELRALQILEQHEAAREMHVADAAGAIAAAAGEDDRHRARGAVLGERAEEHVDGKGQLLRSSALAQEQPSARDDHLFLGRDEVHVIGLDGHAVLNQMDGQRRVTGEELVHQALEIGGEVLNDDERHPRVLRQVVEESYERVEPARRRADADHVLRPLAPPRLIRAREIHTLHRPTRQAFSFRSGPDAR